MRTTLSIDDSILASVMRYTQQANAMQAIRQAVQVFVEQSRRQELLALRGTVDIANNWQNLRSLDTVKLDSTTR
jgi:Arc/MetJ family transcription regulator